MISHNYGLIIILLFGFTLGFSPCSEYDCKGTSNPCTFDGFAPYGNSSAGKIAQIKGVNNTLECATNCCSNEDCNYAFMINKDCFTIACNSPESCKPLYLSDKSLTMILVRVPITVKQCEIGLNACDPGQECTKTNLKSRHGFCKNISTLEVSVLSKNLTLPENEVSLQATTIPNSNDTKELYTYNWELLSHPVSNEQATMEGQTTSHLHLTHLTQGVYVFRVNVKSSFASSSANATISVFQAKRANNTPPTAIINPPFQTITLPTKSVILDASGSTDDDKIISYNWELQKGPIEFAFPKRETNLTTLQIDNLIPGNYTFKLSVEDSDHIQNHTLANITVFKEVDYPPTSNAGKDVILNLPETDLTLNGNLSTDDKGIVSWEWKSIGESKGAVDMQDTNTPFLKLSHLQEGIYQFELKVTDEAGLSSASSVHVFVKKGTTKPPKANAGANQTVILPSDWTILDASASTSADTQITKYEWTQISGPTNATIEKVADDPKKAQIKNLKEGEYEIQLYIEDEAKQNDKSTTKVLVLKKTNEKPKANAGQDFTFQLPYIKPITLNGSNSTDDFGITKYMWEIDHDSNIFNGIEALAVNSSIIELTNLFNPGSYKFKLTVFDADNLTDSSYVTINVQDDPRKNKLIVIKLRVKEIGMLQSDLDRLTIDLRLIGGSKMKFVKAYSEYGSDNGVLVYDSYSENTWSTVIELRSKFLNDPRIFAIDSLLCLDDCSGHGKCVDALFGRKCQCETFWTENFLRKNFGDYQRNCDWSKIYATLVVFLLTLVTGAFFWSVQFLFKMKYLINAKESRNRESNNARTKKTYKLLDDDELEMELKTADISSSEEEEFDFIQAKRKKNGILKNIKT